MPKTLPTLFRELLLLCGALALVGAGIWLLSPATATTPAPTVYPATPHAAKASLATQVETADADRDGLLNFEETLWGTDPENADTDGDGTDDGREVALGRNPRKAGPDDPLETPLKEVPQPRNPQKTAQSGIAPTEQTTETPPPFIVTETPTENPLHRYGNAVGAFIMQAGADATEELAFLNRLAGNKKMTNELIQGLLKMGQKYNRLAKEIASVVPPEKAVIAHSKLAEGYRTYAEAVALFANTPQGAYISGTTTIAYSDSTLALGHAVVDISDLFYRERITFGKDEPGNVFSFPR